MAGLNLAVKTLRPVGKGRAVKRGTEENNQIIKAARNGDIDTLVSMSHSGIDVTTARDWSGDTVLHMACRNGHSTAVAVILTSKISVDVRNTYQQTPMHYAAQSNQIEMIKLLKNSGTTVDAKNNSGSTPLHLAAYNGHTEAVDYLIGIGATVDITNNYQQTPMHYAAQSNQIEMIKLLKNSGATVDAKNSRGDTPLHWAAYNGHTEAVDYLIGIGATVDITNNFGYTPLANAVEGGRGDVVNLLVNKYKADTSKVPQRLQQKMNKLLRKEAELAANSKDVNTRDSQQAQNNSKVKQKKSVNQRTVLAYQQALKIGKRSSNKFKIVLIGAEGAGKTSTGHSLLGEKFQQQQPSTVGADVNACTADRFFATKWKKIPLEHQLKQLPEQFKHELKVCMSNLPTQKIAEADFSTKQKIISPLQSKKEPQLENLLEEKIPDELVTKVQEIVDTEEIHDGDVQIIILDLGGQEIYYHIHFLFLAPEDVVFLAFDASKNLDEPVVCRQRFTRFQAKIKTRGMQTNIQTIEILMQSVYSNCGKFVGNKMYISNRIPTIILVATHCKGLSVQQKNAISDKIFQRFTGRPFMDHLPRATGESIFFIDNSERNPEVFKALQAAALKAAAPAIAEECPVSYLQFEVEILKISQSKATISKQQASAIAEKAGLQGNLIDEVLNHYTLKGTLLYYPEVELLKNEVFISPQEISDMISSVISTHNCVPSSASLQLASHRYDTFGLLEEDLLDDMLKSAVPNRYNDKSIILGFLEKFHLAAEVPRDTKFAEEDEFYEVPKTGRVFLVPSMLVYNPEEVAVKHKGDIILNYCFPDKFVPESFFNQVLVNTVSWSQLQGHCIHSVFHGVGCFQFKGKTQSFKLQRCPKSFSIKCYITVHRYNVADDILDTMLLQRQQLRHHLEQCIDEAHQSYTSCARQPIGYLECPLHAAEENIPPHIRLDRLTLSNDVTCPRSSECQVVPRKAYALLFTKSLEAAGVSVSSKAKLVEGAVVIRQIKDKQSTPTMRDLNRYVIKNYAAEWKDIGIELGLQLNTLEIFSENHQKECVSCFQSTLNKWLNLKPNADWRMLEVAITNVRRASNGLDPVTDVYGSS